MTDHHGRDVVMSAVAIRSLNKLVRRTVGATTSYYPLDLFWLNQIGKTIATEDDCISVTPGNSPERNTYVWVAHGLGKALAAVRLAA